MKISTTTYLYWSVPGVIPPTGGPDSLKSGSTVYYPTRTMTQVTNTVRFVLDGKIVEAQGERRTTTVLDYLREQLHRTGTMARTIRRN